MPARKAFASIYHFILFFFLFSFIIFCCKTPVTDPELPRGERDYVWTVDTLSAPDNPFMAIFRIWGSDIDNVWAMGMGGRDGIWRFDGEKWVMNTTSYLYTVLGLYGFSRYNVWAGNEQGHIYKCTDSKNWTKVEYNRPLRYKRISYSEMWGPSPNEIYAVGSASDSLGKIFYIAITKYDGKSWSVLNTPDLRGQIIYIRKQKKSEDLLLVTMDSKSSTPNIRKIYSFNGKDLINIFPGDLVVSVNDMEGEVYFVINQRIYKYWNGMLVLWKDFRGTIYGDRIWGRNESDFFFASMINGKYGIGHYNGENLVELFHPEPNFPVFEGVILKDDVFFLGYDDLSNKSIIVHGKRRHAE